MYLPLRAWREVLADLGISRRAKVQKQKRPKQMKRGARLRIIEALEERKLMTTTLYWDPSHQIAAHSNNTSYGGGTGTWDTSSTNTSWYEAGVGYVPWTNSVDYNAVFTGTSTSTVTLTGSITVGNITFSTTGATLTGGNLDLGTVTVNSDYSDTINSDIGGSGITTAGTGTLVLGGTNTYSGGVGVGVGDLIINSSGALTTDTYLTMDPGGTLDLNGPKCDSAGSNGVRWHDHQ